MIPSIQSSVLGWTGFMQPEIYVLSEPHPWQDLAILGVLPPDKGNPNVIDREC